MCNPNRILGSTLLLAGVALCGIGLWLLLSPAQYRATTRITVDDSNIIGMSGPPHNASEYDPYFIQTEFEVIQSQAILGKVINSLNLNVEWGRKYAGGGTLTTNAAIAILKRHLQITLVRNTKLIEISFTGEDPDEAASVANAVAETYQGYRLERRSQEMLKGILALEAEYQKEEQAIKAKQESLDQLRKQLNVPNPEPADELLKTNFPSYFQAKQELQKKIDFLKLLASKITSERLVLLTPYTATLQIIDAAQPPELPVSPNRFLGAVLLAIGLFPTVCGFLMLKSSRHPVRL